MKGSIIGIVISYWAFIIGGVLIGRLFSLWDSNSEFFILIAILTLIFIGLQLLRSRKSR